MKMATKNVLSNREVSELNEVMELTPYGKEFKRIAKSLGYIPKEIRAYLTSKGVGYNDYFIRCTK